MKEKVSASQNFGKNVGAYQQYRREYPAKAISLIAQSLKKDDSATVLDLGCGSGKSTESLVRLGNMARIIGCDPDSRMLRAARQSAKDKQLPIIYKQGKAEKIPAKDSSVDLVTTFNAFHWFQSNEALREVVRILKTKGRFAVVWTGYQTKAFERKESVGRAILKKYFPQATSAPRRSRDISTVKDILLRNGLKKIHAYKIPNPQYFTREERVGILKTLAGYSQLNKSEQEMMLRAAELELTRRFGKKKNLLVHQAVFIVLGEKV